MHPYKLSAAVLGLVCFFGVTAGILTLSHRKPAERVGVAGFYPAKTTRAMKERPPLTAQEYRNKFNEEPPQNITVYGDGTQFCYIHESLHRWIPARQLWFPVEP